MLHTHEVTGSSPVVSTIHEKSELLHNRKCVRIFCLYQRHYILMLLPRGFYRLLGTFCLSTHLKHYRFLPKMKSEIKTRRKGVFKQLLKDWVLPIGKRAIICFPISKHRKVQRLVFWDSDGLSQNTVPPVRIGNRICLHGTSSVSNDQIKKLFDDGICKVNIWTALERDASPALTESSKTAEKASLQHFTTTARQEIVFDKMKCIARGYFNLWYC